MRVIAIGFNDLLMLKQAVQDVLKGLLHVPDEDREVTVTFYWRSNDLVVMVDSSSLGQKYIRDTPQGVSTREWAVLVSDELENHLLSGNRFIVRDVMHGDEPNSFVLPLVRA